MADHTKIEWADATVNAVNGCSVLSPGCTNCYAMKLAGTRMKHHPSRAGLTREVNGNHVWTGEVRLNETALLQPLRWKRPRRIFWNAHGDLFHEAVPDEWIDRVFAVCALTPQHQHLILTKRSARMREYLQGLSDDDAGRASPRITLATNFALLASGKGWGACGSTGTHITTTIHGSGAREPFMLRGTGDGGVERLVSWRDGEKWFRCSDAYADRVPDWLKNASDGGWAFKEWPLPNVWLGVSVEDQARADQRIPDLLATPAAARFISAEPLLGPVDLFKVLAHWQLDTPNSEKAHIVWGARLIDWVIAGGESGPNARPMHPDWARGLRDQCAAAIVPFFFKQWGEWFPGELADDGAYLRAYPDNDHDPDAVNWTGQWKHTADCGGMLRVGKAKVGRLLDGVEHSEFPA